MIVRQSAVPVLVFGDWVYGGEGSLRWILFYDNSDYLKSNVWSKERGNLKKKNLIGNIIAI